MNRLLVSIAAAVVLTGGLLPGCAASMRPDALRTPDAHAGVGCTPLALMVAGEGWLGMGSGVLVHRRVVLTAAHIDDDPQRLIVQSFPGDDFIAESIRVRRVVSGGGAGAIAGDWALLVLEHPFHGLAAEPATLPKTAPPLEPGDPVIVAGFPADGKLLDRRPLLVHSVCIAPPLGARIERDSVYVRGTKGEPDHAGLSGAPVLVMDPDGVPVLAGVYLGSLKRHLAGWLLGQEMVIHTLPLDEIRRVIAEVEAEDWTSGASGS